MKLISGQCLKEKITMIKLLIYGLLSVLWIIAAVLTIKAMWSPIEIEKSVVQNVAQDKVNFKYKVEVEPNALYPQGGIIEPDGAIFTAVTNNLVIDFNRIITSEKPVVITGNQRVDLYLSADELWHKKYELYGKSAFSLNGTDNKVINQEFTINLAEIVQYIKDVEDSIKVRGGRYQLKIKPEIEGTISFENKIVPIDNTPEINFVLISQQMKLPEKKEFIKETTFDDKQIIEQYLTFFNKEMPVRSARYVFPIVFFVLFLILSVIFKMERGNRLRRMSKIERMEKNKKSKLVDIKQQINLSEKTLISLQSLKELMKLADEKEQPVFRFEAIEDNKVIYSMPDGLYIYKYETITDDILERCDFFYGKGKQASESVQ